MTDKDQIINQKRINSLKKDRRISTKTMTQPADQFDNPEYYRNFLNIFSGLLGYVDNLEQDLFDLRVILGTTVQQSSDLENELARHQEISKSADFFNESEPDTNEKAAYLDHIREAVFVYNSNNTITYLNNAAVQLYGWQRSDLLGKNVWETLYSEISDTQKEKISSSLASKGEWCGQLKQKSMDNQAVIVDSKWVHMSGSESNAGSTLVTNTNITEKKMLELQFFRVQRMEGIGSLASGIAHDLNNVLTLFFMSVRALQPRLKDEQSQTILSLLDSNAKRGVNLVRQILTFAKGMDSEQIDIELAPIINEIEGLIQRTFPKNIQFSHKAPDKLGRVFGNSTQLHQVLLNLCLNARDALPQGGKLIVTAENKKLSKKDCAKIKNLDPGPHILIKIKDTGTGIPDDIKAKIFEPFFTTKESGKGTGLGLSTVMTIIRNHNGQMLLESKPNKGTTFKIYLPAIQS
ncbi:nitrogen regulation protein NR(II) [Thermoproteota archaeon]